jgi:hypothetical protein
MTSSRDARFERRESLSELEPELHQRLRALDEPVARDDWQDVLRRSRAARFSGLRRPTTPQVATIVVAMAAGIAIAVIGLSAASIIHVNGNGSAASAPREFARFDLGAPPHLPPDAIAWQSRIITSVRLRDGTHTLYVAPTTRGGFCYEWTGDGTGGCAELGTGPLAASWRTGRVVGVISAIAMSSVTVSFTDGTSGTPQIAWISAPINAGFFLYEIPPGKTVALVTGTNNGRPLNQVTWYSA